MINEGYDLIDILELEKREIGYKYDRLIYNIDKLQNKNSDLQEELEYLTERIDKAIEYIKEELYEVGGCVHGSDLPYDEAIQPLLEILGDKE